MTIRTLIEIIGYFNLQTHNHQKTKRLARYTTIKKEKEKEKEKYDV